MRPERIIAEVGKAEVREGRVTQEAQVAPTREADPGRGFLRDPTVWADKLRPYRPPVFSGPPTLITSTTAETIRGDRIEICGYFVDLTLNQKPFQYLRNDGPDPYFWVVEFTEVRILQIASAFAGTRTWYYTSG